MSLKNKEERRKQFLRIFHSINDQYPNDPIKQLQAFEQEDPCYRVMGVARILQQTLTKEDQDITISSKQLELIYRAINDLASHLYKNSPDLPDEAYDYSYYNIIGVSKYLLDEIDPVVN